ncbi:DUF202 domain-containing protein [Bailinhaonella thermotolerans]|uniref:DUF202 domain-containing protein n=1 Tax=Bailinhaonella thermotolerans TaxID=1070861 RepID=A0A3A4ATY4_9ACTN|nr:DUF202 domain-containing protein [Bailinhaonella thermotolerans]
MWDTGAQPERTALAWNRTALSLAVCGLVGLRLSGGPVSMALCAAVTALAAVLLLRTVHRRHLRRQRRLRAGEPIADPAAVLHTAAVTTLLGLTALVVVLERARG